MDSLLGTADLFSTRCVLTWKLKLTPYGRLLFQLQPSTRRTEETAFGLLPTPRTADIEGGCVNNVQIENGSYFRTNANGVRWGVKLRDVAESGLLPTPTTRDANGIEHSPSQKNKSRLAPDIETLYQETHGKTSQLNPRFVAEMMGFPPNWTELPFLNGETKA